MLRSILTEFTFSAEPFAKLSIALVADGMQSLPNTAAQYSRSVQRVSTAALCKSYRIAPLPDFVLGASLTDSHRKLVVQQ